MKVVFALLNSRASRISFGSSCGWFSRKDLSILGAFVFSVNSYFISALSNSSPIDLEFQISTSRLYSFLILWSICFSLSPRSLWIVAAFSKSTRMPFHLILIKVGSNDNSKSRRYCRSAFKISVDSAFQRSKVALASCSAYGPTYIAGSFHISLLAFTPHSLAASCKTRSFLDDAM